MGRKRTEINPSERKIIVDLWKKGKSMRSIGQIVSRTHSSIQGVINNYKSTKTFVSKPRSGRPSKLTNGEKRYVISSVK